MRVKYKTEEVIFYFDKMRGILIKIIDPYSNLPHIKNSPYSEKKNIYLCNMVFHSSELYESMVLYIPSEPSALQKASIRIKMNKIMFDVFVYLMHAHHTETATKEIVKSYLEEKNNYVHYREFNPIPFMFDIFTQIINFKIRAFPTHQAGQLIAKLEIISNYYKFDIWEVFEKQLNSSNQNTSCKN